MANYFGLRTSVPFPPLLTILYQVAIFFVLEDTWHYWMHCALHIGPLYRYFHNTYYHYSAPFGLAAEYASPIEVALLGLGTLLPRFSGAPSHKICTSWLCKSSSCFAWRRLSMHIRATIFLGVWGTSCPFGQVQTITIFIMSSSLGTTQAASAGGIAFFVRSTNQPLWRGEYVRDSRSSIGKQSKRKKLPFASRRKTRPQFCKHAYFGLVFTNKQLL